MDTTVKIISGLYLLFILYTVYGIFRSKNSIGLKSKDKNINEPFSIIVCTNKGDISHILGNLKNIQNIEFQLIIVDDRSPTQITIDDKSSYNFDIKLITILEIKDKISPKKNGINLGVKAAKYNKIITIDDDTIIDRNYLQEVYQINIDKYKYTIGLIKPYSQNNTLFSKIAILDFIGYNLISIGLVKSQIPIYSNANNQLFSRDTFLKLNPYKDNMEILSGDDTFLLNKMDSSNNKYTSYYNENFVTLTDVPFSIIPFIKQRIRWVSKSHKIENRSVFIISLLLYLYNIFVLTTLLFSPISFIYLFITKFLSDFILLYPTIDKFRKRNSNFEDFTLKNLIKFLFITELFQLIYVSILPILGITKGNKKW